MKKKISEKPSEEDLTFNRRLKRFIVGAPKNIHDPKIFHKLALIPFLAWVGLGADGLSSSAYGPEEAFRAITSHTYIALFLAIATSITVLVLSFTYSKIIEHFPHGGGGYIVATHMLGEKAGVISGSSLIVDYILTITVSITSCADALFSYLPLEYQKYKVIAASFLIILLVILNIRGVKESISILVPIFLLFVATHLLLIGYGILSHISEVKTVAATVHTGMKNDLSAIGIFGMIVIFLRAYSLGGGTYTGIEAVSNGLQIMREPKVKTGKRTMVYLASSLAFTSCGLFICYLLFRVMPTEGKTLNSVLADNMFGGWRYGHILALVTIVSEGALLFLAAQAGFIDAPRVIANMAIDSWFPHRFASLSERLTMQNGVVLIGSAALLLLWYTHGSISALIVMYSINVFITFSLSQLSMVKFTIKNRDKNKGWKKELIIFSICLIMCVSILIITIIEKFAEGGWLTILVTLSLVAVCYFIRNHYRNIRTEISKLNKLMKNIPVHDKLPKKPIDKREMTAIQLVGGFSGVGIHTTLSIIKSFKGLYKNFVFVSVAIVDQGFFKGEEGVENLRKATEESLQKYVALAHSLGLHAEFRYVIGTDIVDSATDICKKVSKEFPKSTVFSGQLAFKVAKFYHKILHNETGFAIQRRLQWDGITNVIMPIRMDV